MNFVELESSSQVPFFARFKSFLIGVVFGCIVLEILLALGM